MEPGPPQGPREEVECGGDPIWVTLRPFLWCVHVCLSMLNDSMINLEKKYCY